MDHYLKEKMPIVVWLNVNLWRGWLISLPVLVVCIDTLDE
jgi:hypothetical protein